MVNPLVSVVLPTYNRSHLLQKVTASVAAQKYRPLELVIVDDGSTDATPNIIASLDFPELQLTAIRNVKNLGMVGSLQAGIAAARGTYIARIDDDDAWIDPHKLEQQVAFLQQNSDHVLVGGGVVKVNTAGKEIDRYLPPISDRAIRQKLLITNVFTHSSVLFLKNTFLKVGGYKEKFGFFADWELWLNMGTQGKIANLPRYVVQYTENDYGAANSHDRKIRRKLYQALEMKTAYRTYYRGYGVAVLFACISFVYSFLPLRSLIANMVIMLKKKYYGFGR